MKAAQTTKTALSCRVCFFTSSSLFEMFSSCVIKGKMSHVMPPAFKAIKPTATLQPLNGLTYSLRDFSAALTETTPDQLILAGPIHPQLLE